MTTISAPLRPRGIAVDLRVGESLTLQPDGGGQPIVLTLEAKNGQRGRVRIAAAETVQIGRPERKTAPIG